MVVGPDAEFAPGVSGGDEGSGGGESEGGDGGGVAAVEEAGGGGSVGGGGVDCGWSTGGFTVGSIIVRVDVDLANDNQFANGIHEQWRLGVIVIVAVVQSAAVSVERDWFAAGGGGEGEGLMGEWMGGGDAGVGGVNLIDSHGSFVSFCC